MESPWRRHTQLLRRSPPPPGRWAIRYCDSELCPEVFHKTQPYLVLPVPKSWCGPAGLSAPHLFFFLTDKETEPGGGRLINFHNVASESGRKGDGRIFLLSQPRANPGAAGSAPAEPPGNALPRACLTPGSPAPRRGAPCSGWPGMGGPSLWPRCWCLYTQLGSGTGPSHPPWEQSHGSPQGRHSTCRGSDGS